MSKYSGIEEIIANIGDFTGLVVANTISGSVSGNAGTVTKGVYTDGNQLIDGIKTFSSAIAASITGNAASVTNGVYTTGNQTIGGIKTFSSTVQGDISGNAATVNNGVYTSGNQTIGGVKTFSSTIGGNVSGNSSTTSDTTVVRTTGGQTIAGTKTFSSTIAGSINGNSATVTNGVYTTGNQTIGGIKTFSSIKVTSGPDLNTNGIQMNSHGISEFSSLVPDTNGTRNIGGISNNLNVVYARQLANRYDSDLEIDGAAGRSIAFQINNSTRWSIVADGTLSANATLDMNSNVIREQGVFPTQIKCSSADAFRMSYGSYGAFFRNDGSTLYLMLTAVGQAESGGWNSLRPMTVGLSSGNVGISNNVGFDHSPWGSRWTFGFTGSSGQLRPANDTTRNNDHGSHPNGYTFGGDASGAELGSPNQSLARVYTANICHYNNGRDPSNTGDFLLISNHNDDAIGFATAAVWRWSVGGPNGHFYPESHNTYNVGRSGGSIKNLYRAGVTVGFTDTHSYKAEDGYSPEVGEAVKLVGQEICQTELSEDSMCVGVVCSYDEVDEYDKKVIDAFNNEYTVTGTRLYHVATTGDSLTPDFDGVRVCDEGGDVTAGDFLCSSSGYPGHLKRQSDNVHKNFTVAKCMEDVTFSGSPTVSGIYCYLIGN